MQRSKLRCIISRDLPHRSVPKTTHLIVRRYCLHIVENILLNKIILILAAFAISTAGHAADLVEKTSPHSVQETMDKLEAAVKKAGAGVAARVNHAAAAESVGIELAPNQVLIFGNPNIGSPIFLENPAAGLDLPIRVVVYENASGQTIVAYREPAALAESFDLSPEMKSFQMMAGALTKLTDAATSQ